MISRRGFWSILPAICCFGFNNKNESKPEINNWIEIRKEKPPVNELVLLTMAGGKIIIGQLWSNGEWTTAYLTQPKKDISFCWVIRSMTHWMRIPKPALVKLNE